MAGFVKSSLVGLLDVLARLLSALAACYLALRGRNARMARAGRWTLSPKPSQSSNPVGPFDNIFLAEGKGIPVPYLRALAKRESNNNPREASGPAWGLLQVGINENAGNVLKSYNERHGTSYSKEDMLDPTLNVRVAAELLARIVANYKRLGIEPNWMNPNFVGLVTAGWNSGWSNKGGTGKVVLYLRESGRDVTLENVYRYAQEANATRHLSNPKKQKWQRSVVARYFSEANLPLSEEGKGNWTPLLLMLLLVLSQR